MAKMTLEYAEARVSIDGSDTLIERERAAFYDSVRSLESSSSDKQFQDKEREPESGRKSAATWAELKQAADEGRLSDLVKSGDRLPLVLKNGDRVDLDVGLDESGRTYFIFHNSMTNRHQTNFKWTNKGGWRNCEMRRYANEEVFNLLPDEVKTVIVPTRVVQVLDGERIEVNDQLFCLSATQVFGKNERWNEQEPEDTQIDIFREPRARVKVWLGADEARTSWWWLRSAYTSYYFDYVNSGGYYYTGANNFGTVALSFCIEESK